MSISSSSRSRRGSSAGILSVMLLMVALMAIVRPLLAQTVVDREDPLSTDTVLLRPFAWMTGAMTECRPQAAEAFGRVISATGDLNGDRIADFGVNRYRCDTAFHDLSTFLDYPDELLIYHGTKGSIPSALDGQRVGPTEIGSTTTFLAAGDWDADGYKDLVVRVHLFGDSSFGNTKGYTLSSVVIFWGSAQGYSIQDTTRLSCGTQAWLGGRDGISSDFDGDGVEDLAIWMYGGGFTNGSPVALPSILMFRGHRGRRWGTGEVSRLPDWGFWNAGSITGFEAIDQDCDGSNDIVFYGIGYISVVYGRKGALPDTSSVERIDLTPAPVFGSHPLLSDLTGDHVPELVLNCSDERVRIYAGKSGQRLLDLFGTGNDPADPDHGRPYSRPWVTLDMPHRLHDGWSPTVGSPIYDFGDMNLDGYRDVWTYSDPFIICYGSGKHLDSKIDAMFDTRDGGGFRSLTWLGDIDGSGYESFAISDGTTPGTIQFVKLDRQWEIGSDVAHPFPHPEGFVCLNGASVDRDDRSLQVRSSLTLSATPNPACDAVTISWHPANLQIAVTITVTDAAGRVVDRITSPVGAGSLIWSSSGVARGLYYVTLRSGAATATVPVALD